MKRLGVLVATLLVVVTSACSGNNDSQSNELRPAGEVVEEQKRGDILEPGEIGKIDDIEITADKFVFDDDGTDDEKIIRVFIRAENRSNDELMVPLALIYCADGREGSWYVSSTLDVYDVFPPDTFAEGELVLSVPANCEEPVLRVEDNEDSPNWRVPESALTQ